MPPEVLTKKVSASSFEVGDLVDSFGCEEGRPYMPGTGKIIEIRKGEERPFVCKHDGKLFHYKASEIEPTDMY